MSRSGSVAKKRAHLKAEGIPEMSRVPPTSKSLMSGSTIESWSAVGRFFSPTGRGD